MSLDNLHFPEIVIAELYKNTLVAVKDNPLPDGNATITSEPASDTLQYLGDHLKKTCILVDYPNDLYISEAPLGFLANVLKACSLNLADIAIVNQAKQQASLKTLRNQLNPENLISFGIHSTLSGLPEIPVFTITQYENMALLNAPALEAFNINNEESKLLKTKLWFCLKEMFKVS